jgi:hypothetical protein
MRVAYPLGCGASPPARRDGRASDLVQPALASRRATAHGPRIGHQRYLNSLRSCRRRMVSWNWRIRSASIRWKTPLTIA